MSRIADQLAYMASDVRRIADMLPNISADLRRVVDDMVASRHEAQAASVTATGTSSGGGTPRPPHAPSTTAREGDALPSTAGSDGGAHDGASVHQPTPQVGDAWEERVTGQPVRIVTAGTRYAVVRAGDDWTTITMSLDEITKRCRLVERDGKPWPPTQESAHLVNPTPYLWGGADAVEPATDEQIRQWEHHVLPVGSAHHAIDRLIARVRQLQRHVTALVEANEWLRAAEAQRDKAVARAESAESATRQARRACRHAEGERDEAVARAGKAMQLLVDHMERLKRERDEARSLLTPDQLSVLSTLDDLEAFVNEVNTQMEPSFDSKATRHTYPAAPPRPPAAGVADIDDAGTLSEGDAR